MHPENIPFHLSALASILADVIVGFISIQAYRATKNKGWGFLAWACGLFLVGSVYGYLIGLTEYGIIEWPLNDVNTLRAYYLTSLISIASQACFVLGTIFLAQTITQKIAEQGACTQPSVAKAPSGE